MTYAIISDIHGNYPALKAALADAHANGAHHFIFLGDYTCTFPFQNEITETIRALPHKTVIRGNHEDYLTEIHNNAPDTPIPKVHLPIFWSYQRLTAENRKYYFNLPATAQISDEIFLSHRMDLFFRTEGLMDFHAAHYKQTMEVTPFTHTDYLQSATKALLARTDVMKNIRALPEGVYLFGHNHLQFHTEMEGRLFVNPGSCGLPLDYDTRAAYTLLKRVDNQCWQVTERRVDYDMTEVLEAMQNSGFSKKFPEWESVHIQQLRTASDSIGSFIQHLKDTAHNLGMEDPFDDAVWDKALASYPF